MKRLRIPLVMIAALALMALAAAPALAANANLVTNGNFSAGNTGFSSQYTYVDPTNPSTTGPMGDPGMYTIGTDPSLFHGGWASYLASPSNNGGNMMIVNGMDTSAGIVWQNAAPIALPSAPQSYPLYAGQNWRVGDVLVKAEPGHICVKYEITDQSAIDAGWLITAVHADVADTAADIPQMNGNPTPGHFTVNATLDPGVTSTGWYCMSYAWTSGAPLVVAAQAEVTLPAKYQTVTDSFKMASTAGTTQVTSDPGVTDFTAGTAGLAWDSTAMGASNPWDSQMQGTFPITAAWVWDTLGEKVPLAGSGDAVGFTQPFNVVGTPTSATLTIAADNAFAWNLNDGALTAENLTTTSPITAASVIDPSPSAWSKVYNYDVTADLVSGPNTLNVTGVNAPWYIASWSVNPAGVKYCITGTSQEQVLVQPAQDETAWGGTSDFSGKNWATYISYTPSSSDYQFTLWAANSYAGRGTSATPANPAQLQVSVNGDVIGTADLSTITNDNGIAAGKWQEFTFTWNAGSATSATIQINDQRQAYWGDDYAIDNIGFVQQ